jgi:hypothetical protein
MEEEAWDFSRFTAILFATITIIIAIALVGLLIMRRALKTTIGKHSFTQSFFSFFCMKKLFHDTSMNAGVIRFI